MSDYEDIINLERPRSLHKPMSMYNRAAQFSPFAALVGYDSMIEETGRLVDSKIELDESQMDEIARVLTYIDMNIDKKMMVKIIYFKKDKYKSGGAYLERTEVIKSIDNVESKIRYADRSYINIEDILSVQVL